jgi:hypothetical protein
MPPQPVKGIASLYSAKFLSYYSNIEGVLKRALQ